MMSLTRCGPHDSTITRSSGRGGVDVGGVAEGKRRRWRCSLFHISSAVDFFINTPPAHPHLSSPPPPPPLPFLLHHHLPLETYRGDVQQTLNAELKSLDAAAYVCDHTELKVYTHLRHSRYTAWVFQELQDFESTWQNNHHHISKQQRKAL